MRTPKTSNTASIVLAIAAIVAIVAVAAGGFRVSRTDEPAEEGFYPARITDIPLIVAKRESGGFGLLGVQLDAPDRWLSVAVKPPARCLRADGEQEVVIGGEGCDTVEGVAGPVKGGGVTAEGERWVELWVEVDKDCHLAAVVGDTWPALPESCR